jgi:hypothetical protein
MMVCWILNHQHVEMDIYHISLSNFLTKMHLLRWMIGVGGGGGNFLRRATMTVADGAGMATGAPEARGGMGD